MANVTTAITKDVISVAIEIYAAQSKGKPHHFSSLVTILDGKITRNRISLSIGMLTDLCLLQEEYGQIDEHRCGKLIKINDIGMPLVKGWMREAMKDYSNAGNASRDTTLLKR